MIRGTTKVDIKGQELQRAPKDASLLHNKACRSQNNSSLQDWETRYAVATNSVSAGTRPARGHNGSPL